VEGNKVTVGPPFYNRVAVPIGIFLLLLTGVGPLLPWRAATLRAIRRNFVMPSIAVVVTAIICFAVGVRPWNDHAFDAGNFYALVALALAAGVLTAILSEFWRGAGVIARQTRRNLFAATCQLIRRNTRRYGGYIVHIGVVILIIGLTGAAFNRTEERELALHDKLRIGPYTLESIGVAQDSNPNYNSESARLDVYRNGKKSFQIAPERRVYLASEQPQTMAAIHSAPGGDLYVVYEGANPDTGLPIIKAFLNPLVGWIWAGLIFMVFGTFVALTPSLKPVTATLRIGAVRTMPAEAALKGGD
jgi:cytochrome c-type biogenesis protein CcmF